jgi:DNA-binding transcriptional MerR regulator
MVKMGKTYFTTKDVIQKVGISRTTLFLWFWNKKIPEVQRNRNGHRIFTVKDINYILRFKNKLTAPSAKA